MKVYTQSRVKWAGHMARMKDERLPKRSETKKMGGLCEERFEKDRGGRKIDRKCQQQGIMEINCKSIPSAE